MHHTIRTFLAAALLLAVSAPLPAQITFRRHYGGPGYEEANSGQQTRDGGYVIAGWSDSYTNNWNAMFLKVDSLGNREYANTFGGQGIEEGNSVRQTTDGGYILAAETRSFGAGGSDGWLIKIDSLGATQWTRTYGGTDYDGAHSAQQTADGGYIITGYTSSYGTGERNGWLIKTDSLGDTVWTRSYSGAGWDCVYSAQQMDDHGYILVGAYGTTNPSDADAWLIKTDSLGYRLWDRTFGGGLLDAWFSIQRTDDGGYVIVGRTRSYGPGDCDAWLVKLDRYGDTVWTRTFGGPYDDWGLSGQQTDDGGYVVAGWTMSFGAGEHDAWLIKTDSLGDTVWTRTHGGTRPDLAWAGQQTRDGGYVLMGATFSYGVGNSDVWIVKTDTLGRLGVEEQPPVAVRPTPSATVCRGILRLTADSRQLTASRLELLDVAGRVVLTRPLDRSTTGPLSVDVRHLAPGAYFVRSAPGAVLKVVVME